MPRKLISTCLFISFAFFAKSQQVSPPPATVYFPPSVMLANGDSVLYRVDEEAAFPGGHQAWRAYLTKNLDITVPKKNRAPAGIHHIMVRFIVSKTGKVSGIEAETSIGYGMEKEVVRIIKHGPKWKPATLHGRVVNSFRRQPVAFMVFGK